MRFFSEDVDRTPRACAECSPRRALGWALIGLAAAMMILGLGLYFT